MKVAIIGAGVAGLTAASKLRERGVHVRVYEKSRGLGGRLANKRLDWATIDIGAQYFTARDERFQALLAAWEERGAVRQWHFTPYSLTDSGLTTRTDTTVRYVGTPNMNSFVRSLADGLDISFSTRVEAVHQKQQGWQLVMSDGDVSDESYDWVVFSTPAEQSRELLSGSTLANRIPEHIHEPCWALALATRGGVASQVQGIFGDEVVSWVSRLSSRPERQAAGDDWDDVWMLHFASGWSATHDKDTDVDIAHAGLAWLSDALREYRSEPLETVHAYQHYWRYARVADPQAEASIITDDNRRIAVIGDWTAGGRIEGAYLSALDFIDCFDELYRA